MCLNECPGHGFHTLRRNGMLPLLPLRAYPIPILSPLGATPGAISLLACPIPHPTALPTYPWYPGCLLPS